MTIEPRTPADMIRDLLKHVEEWSERYVPCPRGGYHGNWETTCLTCEADGEDWREREHKPGCSRAALLLEARTYLEVEQQLEDEGPAKMEMKTS